MTEDPFKPSLISEDHLILVGDFPLKIQRTIQRLESFHKNRLDQDHHWRLRMGKKGRGRYYEDGYGNIHASVRISCTTQAEGQGLEAEAEFSNTTSIHQQTRHSFMHATEGILNRFVMGQPYPLILCLVFFEHSFKSSCCRNHKH